MECEFCKITRGLAPATIIQDWVDYNVMAIKPLNPVTPGHVLVLPKEHLRDATVDFGRTATTMLCAVRDGQGSAAM
jgi:histidine triad (HIT) family protein